MLGNRPETLETATLLSTLCFASAEGVEPPKTFTLLVVAKEQQLLSTNYVLSLLFIEKLPFVLWAHALVTREWDHLRPRLKNPQVVNDPTLPV